MRCPNCGSWNQYCIDTRLTGDYERWRRRKCRACGKTFCTVERLQLVIDRQQDVVTAGNKEKTKEGANDTDRQ